MDARNLASRWLPVAAWCGLIFALSSVPHLKSGSSHDLSLRRLAHLVEYGVLYLLARRALDGSPAAGWRAYLFCLAYAASDEWHQGFVPGRMGRPQDVALDALGAALAALSRNRLPRR